MQDNEIKNIVVLGSTGSIGQQTLEVIEQNPGRFRLVGLAARDEVDMLQQQAVKFKPRMVSVFDSRAYQSLKDLLEPGIKLSCGLDGLCEAAAAPEADTVVVALSGAVGIKPTLAAIQAGKTLALANKETLVAAGDVVMKSLREHRGTLLPVDSEHSAIFQCLQGEERHLKRLWVTASGGPFRNLDRERLEKVTVEMALHHPTWTMGPKITVDSATLMNKGLEVIEAHHLFDVGYDQIEVLVQRESVIHSMVELVDGSFLAHLGTADMRIPIQYALSFPERLASPAPVMNPLQLGKIHFEAPDTDRFPALRLAYEAGNSGGTMPAVMNAANEVAVRHFLEGKIAFTRIPVLVEQVMHKHSRQADPDLDTILEADAWARQYSESLL